VGCVGGVYGIGGSILAPVLIGSGRRGRLGRPRFHLRDISRGRGPAALIRRAVGILVIAIGARYLWSGLG
jgi:hypothetical protein